MADQPISAQTMARAATHDPQFAVPARPRVRRGLVIRRYDDRLVVEGTPTRHVLRGRAATQLVPRLLPLLDGVRDHAAVAAELGVSTTTVFTVLSLLWTCGVVEEAAPDTDVSWVPGPLADYLSRIGDATEANAAWEGAADRLATARLRLTGDPRLVAALRTALSGTVPRLDAEDPSLVVVCVTPSHPLDRVLAAACWNQGTPLLHLGLSGDVVEIGPYVDRRLGPCLDCLLDPAAAPGGSTVDDLGLAAALAAADLVALLGRATRVGLPGRWRRIGLTRLAQSGRSGVSRPGCPACSTVPGEPRPAPVSARYEAAVALPPKEYADVKAHQVHYQPANVALQRGHKTWPVAPRQKIPPADLGLLPTDAGLPPAGVDGPRRVAPLDGERLALLLAVAAGWQHETPDRVWRWTASGGNIGSVVAHVLVRDLDGVPPGVYGYVPAGHELALLRPGRPAACSPDCGAPACLLFTGDLPRVASKYGAFGLRVVLLDAGCAQAAVLTVAGALGVPARPAVDLDDERLGDLLGIDLDAEPVTAVIHLGEPIRTGSHATGHGEESR
ncbi:tpaE [Longispora sp. NPDC051575]|uniref:tpaE n=1 Tax=Longispora sp. NPDC051575 TaxID=3154943 RepID=UPI0034434254